VKKINACHRKRNIAAGYRTSKRKGFGLPLFRGWFAWMPSALLLLLLGCCMVGAQNNASLRISGTMPAVQQLSLRAIHPLAAGNSQLAVVVDTMGNIPAGYTLTLQSGTSRALIGGNERAVCRIYYDNQPVNLKTGEATTLARETGGKTVPKLLRIIPPTGSGDTLFALTIVSH
jgi:hypothetical protein